MDVKFIDGFAVGRVGKRRLLRGMAALVASAFSVGAFALAVPVSAQSVSGEPLALARDSYFFVNGAYVKTAAGDSIAGQMYVHAMIPAHVVHRYPIVMMHGGGQTGTNFEGTPDGRDGWAQMAVGAGYAVYVVDQVGRARSSYGQDIYGAYSATAVALTVEHQFTAPERFNLWPQAKFHTQWPGSGPNKGMEGDPIFDQFLSSQVPGIANVDEQEALNKSASGALLDKIGPAIVISHSQSGPYGWQFADARPNLVRAIIAIEPGGPPFYSITNIGAPTYFTYQTTLSRAWGITETKITYSPAVSDPSQIVRVKQALPDGPGLVPCYMQGNPVRQLPTLQKAAILIVSSQASYHSQYDHCTSKYLTQAGVIHDYVRLPQVGIYGNGHMMMIEKNNLAIAHFLDTWLRRKGF